MRKRYWLGGFTVILMLVTFVYWLCLDEQNVTMKIDQGVPVLVVNTQQSSNQVKLWQDEED